MKTIVTMRVGSHLYGTATSHSDVDIKGIYIPSADDILLQKVAPSLSRNRIKKHGEKNTSQDVDFQLYSPVKYLTLLVQGHTIALDMLFAPASALIDEPHFYWSDIKRLAPQLFTKKTVSFVKYCRQQAHKYSLKGVRLASAKQALSALRGAEKLHGPGTKLHCIIDDLRLLAKDNDFLSVKAADELYFDVCGKKALFNASIKSARLIVEKVIADYGKRSLIAEENKGADWKALSHAVRIAHQAREFLTSHHITFPRPERHHLLAIKQGEVPYDKVVGEIEMLLVEVERAAEVSTLPETCDIHVVDNFIKKIYRDQIVKKGLL